MRFFSNKISKTDLDDEGTANEQYDPPAHYEFHSLGHSSWLLLLMWTLGI